MSGARRKRDPLTIRTCRRSWLRVKLHFLVERDEKGRRDFRTFLDAVGSQKAIALLDLIDGHLYLEHK